MHRLTPPPERSRMHSYLASVSRRWIRLVALSALFLSATPGLAAPPHINLTQGQPWTGCSKRVDNLKPAKVPFSVQNQTDATQSYVLRAARILEPKTGAVTNDGYLIVT